MKKNAYMNWSGGKDSSICLHKILQGDEYEIKYLLTSVNIKHNRISMHGVRVDLLQKQAESLNMPSKLIKLSEMPGMDEYEKEMEKVVSDIKEDGIYNAVFGDIFLEDLRRYREVKLAKLGIEAVFPLWKISTKRLMEEFIELGFKAIVVCVNDKFLDKSFCGRIIDRSFVRDLPKNVDVCGENGEYHSYVFDGPIFKKPILFSKGDIVYRQYNKPKNGKKEHYKKVVDSEKKYGFYFCDLLPKNN